MTDTLRNMPRYIRNTDAFGWQGADGPNGPWRSITPPKSGAPWQTTNPMDDLRQASADVSGVEVLSPAAQAVLNAFRAVPDLRDCPSIAAALRAAADQVVPEPSDLDKEMFSIAALRLRWVIRDQLLAIAAELEGAK